MERLFGIAEPGLEAVQSAAVVAAEHLGLSREIGALTPGHAADLIAVKGDPLADVGYLGVYWFDGDVGNVRSNDPTPAGGFPTYAAMLERYATRTGRDLGGIDYYVAFSCWRLAVISEGVYARYLHGAMGDQGVDIEQYKVGVDALAERALAAVRRR